MCEGKAAPQSVALSQTTFPEPKAVQSFGRKPGTGMDFL